MNKPRLLDLFAGAGGAARGYQLAGFHVTGIDNRPQPRYAGDVFIQADALEFVATHGYEYDAIHASPPCQAYSSLKTWNPHLAGTHPDLVGKTRQLLEAVGQPFVIENVVGAPLIEPIRLCGTAFGLPIRRHRLFESNILLMGLTCHHNGEGQIIGVYGDHPEDARVGLGSKVRRAKTLDQGREAMGIDWMVWKELTQAIPPAYTEFIGRQLIAAIAATEKVA